MRSLPNENISPAELSAGICGAIIFAPMLMYPEVAFTWPFVGWNLLFAAIVASIFYFLMEKRNMSVVQVVAFLIIICLIPCIFLKDVAWSEGNVTWKFFVLTVLGMTIMLLFSKHRAFIYGGEWPSEDGTFLFKGQSKFVHIFSLILLTYFSWWYLLIIPVTIMAIWFVMPIAYMIYTGGYWHDPTTSYYTTELTDWKNLGESRKYDKRATNFGMQKWIIFYIGLFLVCHMPETFLSKTAYFALFLFAHQVLIWIGTFILMILGEAAMISARDHYDEPPYGWSF